MSPGLLEHDIFSDAVACEIVPMVTEVIELLVLLIGGDVSISSACFSVRDEHLLEELFVLGVETDEILADVKDVIVAVLIDVKELGELTDFKALDVTGVMEELTDIDTVMFGN